jgi:hypothetical protein
MTVSAEAELDTQARRWSEVAGSDFKSTWGPLLSPKNGEDRDRIELLIDRPNFDKRFDTPILVLNKPPLLPILSKKGIYYGSALMDALIVEDNVERDSRKEEEMIWVDFRSDLGIVSNEPIARCISEQTTDYQVPLTVREAFIFCLRFEEVLNRAVVACGASTLQISSTEVVPFFTKSSRFGAPLELSCMPTKASILDPEVDGKRWLLPVKGKSNNRIQAASADVFWKEAFNEIFGGKNV